MSRQLRVASSCAGLMAMAAVLAFASPASATKARYAGATVAPQADKVSSTTAVAAVKVHCPMSACNGRIVLTSSLSSNLCGFMTEIGSQAFAITGPATTAVNVGLTGAAVSALKSLGELVPTATTTTNFGGGGTGKVSITILLSR